MRQLAALSLDLAGPVAKKSMELLNETCRCFVGNFFFDLLDGEPFQ